LTTATIPKLLRSGPLALGYLLGTAGAQARRQMAPCILMYHGIPRRLAAGFARQLRFLRRHFEILPLASLAASIYSEPGRKPRVALTFDDGLRNNVTVAYPILARLGLPATFFVCPRIAERGRWLWNHEVRQRLMRINEPARQRLAQRLGHRSGEVESLVGWMKALELGARERAEALVRAATPHFSPSDAEREEFDVASLEDLRALNPEIAQVGSHTLTHPILTSLSSSDLEAEVGSSRRELEAALRRPVDFFAYPNGDHDAQARACVRRHYRGAVTTMEERLSSASDLHLLPRHCAPIGALRLAWNMHRLFA
jgi:peptidoglycan/xylan/chitin deacetylase (PgdA/CDA1 family)